MSTTRPVALITGASAGIGAAFAEVFAAHQHDLVLVARSREKLEALADTLVRRHRIRCTVVVSDLARPESPQEIFDTVTAHGLSVDILVNNAGLLNRGPFDTIDLNDHLQLIQVNITACTALAWLFLKPMLARGHGRILNVASTSSFQPIPMLAGYAASKAYLLSFSEALWIETQGTGVTVTALCPGFTNTDMIAKDSPGQSMHVPFIKNMSAEEVAREGFDACMSGEPIFVNGTANRILAEVARIQPRSWRRWLALQVAKRGF